MSELQSTLFLVFDAGDDPRTTDQKLYVSLDAVNKETLPPSGMSEFDFASILNIKALSVAIEEYVGVAADFYFDVGVFPHQLHILDLRRTDGSEEHADLSVDSSMLLAGLIVSCNQNSNINVPGLPIADIEVHSNFYDEPTKSYIVEVRYNPEDEVLDCTRALYLLSKDPDEFKYTLVGSFDLELEKFVNLEGVVLDVSPSTAAFAKSKAWLKQEKENGALGTVDGNDRPTV